MADKGLVQQKIAETLERFGIPYAGNVWNVQGTPVIYHKTLEEIAAKLKITFQLPNIIRAERDECVMMVHGSVTLTTEADGDTPASTETKHEWSIGEALIGSNYRVSGKQAAYVYAMAEKRAKDRVILKLIELAGHVYSEEESDEFKRQGGGLGGDRSALKGRAGSEVDSPAEVADQLRSGIDEAETIEAVTDFMLSADTQDGLNYLAAGVRDEVRAYATKRLKDLGWKPAAKPQGGRGRIER